jgi:pimeloyl-ACP methyl ester carboxylesterase
MIAPLAKLIDWSVIQATTLREPPADGRNPRLEEALQFLNGPDFIPAESQPARVEFYPDKSGLHFEENNVVYGRLYRCAERWQERPVIVLLHGGNDSIGYRFRYPLIARHCNRAGFNAATLVAPYHFQRRPRQLGTLSRPDYLRSAKTHAQAVAEIRALTGWLLGQGCPAVALCGSSYGGRLAGLTVCRDARLATVVLTKPAVGMNPSFAELLFRRRIRESWQKQRAALEALNLTPFNLTLARPAIPKENILLIEAIHDLYVPKEAIEDLWQAWGQPEIWRLPHAHISLSLTPGLTGRILRWLAPRLDAPRVRTGQTSKQCRQSCS